MSTCDAASDSLDVAQIYVVTHDEELEEIQSLSTAVSTSELLHCGATIARNLEAAVAGLRQLMKLLCGVFKNRSEADAVCTILKRASEVLAITVGHIDFAISSVDDALRRFYRCLNNEAGLWQTLPIHLKEVQDHTRYVRELWPQNRDFLNGELLEALTSHFYSPQSIFPHFALWVSRLTGAEHLFPRLRAWGQIPNLVVEICAALDPIPQLLDKVETYAVDMGDRAQLVLPQPSGLQERQMQTLKPSVGELSESWVPYFRRSRKQALAVKGLDPFFYLRYSLGLS